MIPRILHHVWISPNNSGLPYNIKVMADTWKKFSPDLSYNFLNNDKIEELVKKYGFHDFFESMSYTTEKSDLVRFLALYDHGGVYCDTDVEFVRDITPLLEQYDKYENVIVAGKEPAPHNFGSRRLIGTAVILSTPKNEFWMNLIDFLVERYKPNGNPCYTTGPGLLSWMKYASLDTNFKLEASKTFFPISATDYTLSNLEKLRSELHQDVYTIHHWDGKNTWLDYIDPQRLNDFIKFKEDGALIEFYTK